MEIHFTGRNIEVTPALKMFTTDKMQRLERRHTNVNTVNVTFHLENLMHIAEASVHLNGVDLHATAKSEDMYTAIDEMIDKLMTQITKHKEKLTDHHR